MSVSSFYVDVMALHHEVTGSCSLCSVHFPDGKSVVFVVDCGLFQETKYKDLNSKFTFKPERVAFALVTHPHMDHIGRFPLLVRRGFHKKIYLTDSCSKIFPVLLKDGLNILQRNAKYKNEEPLYDKNDYQQTLSHLSTVEYCQKFSPAENINVTFFSNGHSLGSSTILVEISYDDRDSINLFFTGDYNDKNSFFDVEELPAYVIDMPINIITEATYGSVNSDSINNCFQKNIVDAIEDDKTIIIPTFAYGRAQEILFTLKNMQEGGLLSPEVPIYLDGNLAIEITNIFSRNSDLFNELGKDFLPENLTFVSKGIRNEIVAAERCKKQIIVTSSGTGSFGPAPLYISHFLPKKKALIHLVGYAMEGTPSRELYTATDGDIVRVNGLGVIKRCDVLFTGEFSSHGKSNVLLNLLTKFKDLRFIIANHGTTESKKAFALTVKTAMEEIPLGILDRDYLFRMHSCGVLKTFSTKFPPLS